MLAKESALRINRRSHGSPMFAMGSLADKLLLSEKPGKLPVRYQAERRDC